MKCPERFKKTAVIAEPAVRARVQNTASGGNLTAAVLHPEILNVAVDTLHRIFLERPGKVFPACECIFGKRCNGQ